MIATWVANPLRKIGASVFARTHRIGAATVFLFQVLYHSGTSWLRFRLIVRQIYFNGVLSIVIIVISGTFVGMVLALQGYNVLARFGSTEILGAMVALSLLRELGPVMCAILFASRAGSSMTTEIGLMKTTEQLTAMEVMAVNPIGRVVGPRFWAGILSMPLLSAMFSAMGILGGYFVGVIGLKVDQGVFWSQMRSTVRLDDDVINSLIKSLIFGILVSWIAVFEGMRAVPTAEGVSRATTRTVVSSAITVLLADFLLTSIMFSK